MTLPDCGGSCTRLATFLVAEDRFDDVVGRTRTNRARAHPSRSWALRAVGGRPHPTRPGRRCSRRRSRRCVLRSSTCQNRRRARAPGGQRAQRPLRPRHRSAWQPNHPALLRRVHRGDPVRPNSACPERETGSMAKWADSTGATRMRKVSPVSTTRPRSIISRCCSVEDPQPMHTSELAFGLSSTSSQAKFV